MVVYERIGSAAALGAVPAVWLRASDPSVLLIQSDIHGPIETAPA
jgi:hypothetical protein